MTKNSTDGKIVNVIKIWRMHYKECCRYRPHTVTQYKKGKDSLYTPGKRCYDRKQNGYVGQPKPIFQKKGKKIDLTLKCLEPNYRSKENACHQEVCNSFELGGNKKRKDQVIQF
ncbi:60S ribosomal protein L36a-like [Rhincodon typus]|uniref:60S ribosomal protein L36a-like n=1 Tax=Rhincodon typus TaxID=259920 RepID=UPI0009A2869A|nr:60S ribosomal protein L36a-like [Rhincodon typus]